MHSINEIASPAIRFGLFFILFIVLDKLFLLVPFGLEEKTAGFVKGAAQTDEEFARAGQGEGLAERLGDKGLCLRRTTETPFADLVFELLLLGSSQVAQVASVVQSCE